MSNINFNLTLSLKSFEAQARKANSALGGIQKGVDKVKDNTNNANKAWSSFVGNLGAQAFIGVARSLGNMGAGLISAASRVEDLETQFKVLTGSSAQARKTMKELQDFSTRTPFQLEGLAETSQTLLAFGFQAEDLIPKLQSIGDVAAATGNNVKDIGLIFGQVAAAGKLTGERLLQLQQRGVPVLAALGKELGVTEAKARELVSSTEGVSFATFEKAFNSLSQEGGIAFEGMIQKSKTFSGVVSTTKDNVFALAVELGRELLPAAKAVAIGIINMSQAIIQSIKWIKENKELVIALGTAIGVTSGAMLLWASRTAIVNGALKALTLAQAALNIVMNANPVALLITGLGALAGAAVYVARNFDESKKVFFDFSITALKAIEPMETGFRKVFGNILTVWGYTAGTMLQTGATLANGIAKLFGTSLPPAIANIQDTILATAESFKNGGGAIAGEIDRLQKKSDELTTKIAENRAKLAQGDEEGTGGSGNGAADKARQAELEKQRAFNEQLLLLDQEFQGNKILVEQEAEVARAQFRAENQALSTEERLAQEALALEAQFEFEQKKLDITRQAELAKADLIQGEQKKALEKKKINDKFELASITLQNKKKLATEKQATKGKAQLAQEEQQIQASILQSTSSFLRTAGSMVKENSKEAKLLAIADATVQTYLGATRAFGTVPYPANFVAAGSVIAAGLANVAKITSAGNFRDGGVIQPLAGVSSGGDNLTANVNPGEVILNSQQAANTLFQLANNPQGQNQSGGLSQDAQAIIRAFENRPVVLVANDTELARSVSRGVIDGIIIGESN